MSAKEALPAQSTACPQCGRAKELYNATCLQSECQQAAYEASKLSRPRRAARR